MHFAHRSRTNPGGEERGDRWDCSGRAAGGGRREEPGERREVQEVPPRAARGPPPRGGRCLQAIPVLGPTVAIAPGAGSDGERA